MGCLQSSTVAPALATVEPEMRWANSTGRLTETVVQGFLPALLHMRQNIFSNKTASTRMGFEIRDCLTGYLWFRAEIKHGMKVITDRDSQIVFVSIFDSSQGVPKIYKDAKATKEALAITLDSKAHSQLVASFVNTANVATKAIINLHINERQDSKPKGNCSGSISIEKSQVAIFKPHKQWKAYFETRGCEFDETNYKNGDFFVQIASGMDASLVVAMIAAMDELNNQQT
jgi:hypothetical protein